MADWCNFSPSWNLGLRRNLLYNELVNVITVMETLHSWAPSDDRDSLKWTLNANDSLTTTSFFLKLTKRFPSIAAPLICHI